jgi:hypothetical protein
MKRRAKATMRGKRGMEHSGMRWKREGRKIKISSEPAPDAEPYQKREHEASSDDGEVKYLNRRKINRKRDGGDARAGKAGVVDKRGAGIGDLGAGVVVAAGVAGVNIAPHAEIPVEAPRLRGAGKRPVANRKDGNIAGRAAHVRRKAKGGEEEEKEEEPGKHG